MASIFNAKSTAPVKKAPSLVELLAEKANILATEEASQASRAEALAQQVRAAHEQAGKAAAQLDAVEEARAILEQAGVTL